MDNPESGIELEEPAPGPPASGAVVELEADVSLEILPPPPEELAPSGLSESLVVDEVSSEVPGEEVEEEDDEEEVSSEVPGEEVEEEDDEEEVSSEVPGEEVEDGDDEVSSEVPGVEVEEEGVCNVSKEFLSAWTLEWISFILFCSSKSDIPWAELKTLNNWGKNDKIDNNRITIAIAEKAERANNFLIIVTFRLFNYLTVTLQQFQACLQNEIAIQFNSCKICRIL